MKARNLFFRISLLVCFSSIILIMLRGKPADKVSFGAVSHVAEDALYHAGKIESLLINVSDSEEISIGDKIYAQLSRDYKEIKNEKTLAYVNKIVGQMQPFLKRRAVQYKIHIVHASFPNAFAIPGGHIYLTDSLLKVIGSEAQLAFILAHEIIHVDAGHVVSVIKDGDIVSRIFLSPIYSKSQEAEADYAAVYLISSAGYYPLAAIDILKKISGEDSLSGYTNPVAETVEATGMLAGRYFDTHPPLSERVYTIQEYTKTHKVCGRFYIGKQNYEEKIPKTVKAYKGESLWYCVK